MALNNIERSFIATIAKNNPHTFKEVEDIYLKTKSFDTTIEILKLSRQGIPINEDVFDLFNIEKPTSDLLIYGQIAVMSDNDGVFTLLMFGEKLGKKVFDILRVASEKTDKKNIRVLKNEDNYLLLILI